MPETHLVSVFTSSGDEARGGNPCPVMLDADLLSTEDMRAVAKQYGHESSFLSSPPAGSGADYELRFFVPEHEMEMCGHATAGTTWLLEELGRFKDERKEVTYMTKSGLVQARMVQGNDGRGNVAEVSQPRGWVKAVEDESLRKEIVEVLRIKEEDLHATQPIQNACTSRAKTMIPLRDMYSLNGLTPDFTRIKALCEKLDSTGLYPYAMEDTSESEGTHIQARQFPKASGYPEDAATGIAAAALSWAVQQNGLLEDGLLVVRQGVAMGSPSEIRVRVEENGCWIGGTARRMERK